MSLNLHCKQRPASLQLISTHGAVDSQSVTSRIQIRKDPSAADQSDVLISKTLSLVPVTATLPSSPTRSASHLNRTTPTTTNSTGRTESPTKTTFVTVVITRSSSEEEERETPPATKTVFCSLTPQVIHVTISAVPSATAVAGSPQAQGGQVRTANGPTLTQTAKIFLVVLGVICK